MKKIFTILLALVMLLSLAACGGDNPNAGVYDAVSCTAMGFSMDCEGDYLELKGNGRGTLVLMGEEVSCKWSLDGENLTITNHGDEFYGTLHNGIITMDFSEVICVYIMDEITMEDGTVRGHIHQWQEADCVNPKNCPECGVTEGEALGHDATEANYQDASVCNNCGETLEEKLQPAMEKHGITEFMELGVAYDFTTATYRKDDVATTCKLTITDYDIFTSAEGYPEKEGYEWRVIKGNVTANDKNANNYGYSVHYCFEDYYDIELSDDNYEHDEETEISTCMCSYHGEEMPYYFKEEWQSGKWIYNKEIKRKETTGTFVRAWQVPVGYDGIVAGFYNPVAVSWDDRYIYEIYDPENFWLFRLDNESGTVVSIDNSIAGTYTLYAMEADGEYLDNDTIVSLGIAEMIQIVLNGDGTGTLALEGEEEACTYTDTELIDKNGTACAYSFEDRLLVLELEEGVICYCQKN